MNVSDRAEDTTECKLVDVPAGSSVVYLVALEDETQVPYEPWGELVDHLWCRRMAVRRLQMFREYLVQPQPPDNHSGDAPSKEASSCCMEVLS